MPVIAVQLEGDAHKVRQSIIIGSAIALLMFIAWNAVILGSVNSELVKDVYSSKTVFDPLQILRDGGAGEWLGILVSVFSEFAIATSFIRFVYGLLDFFKDIPVCASNNHSTRLPLYGLIIFPPMSLGMLNPSIFFTALDYAGTFCISVLGEILPALMAWKQRQQQKYSQGMNIMLVPGSWATLALVIFVSLSVIFKQILSF
ncbi:aromatic amino acid transport family protein [Chlorogloeopsis fritschii]|uniref:aromatic amino acid transport family protein n=1 Tax=Chlorogloeopsis fritschii TaxID=1124 RepID=UPI0008FC0BBB|nr:aromatic amino acid transport family protein [Chlorogloeopsis fritschii]